MITYKKKILDKIKEWDKNDIYILTDFDRTLTTGDSESSWGVLASSKGLSDEYVLKRQELYNKYRPIELDEEMDFDSKNKKMIEWWEKHIELLIIYKLQEGYIEKISKDIKVMKFRRGAIDWLGRMYEQGIPVVIMSAGIGNFIEQFLRQNDCYYSNIYIVSNFIKFEDNLAVGMEDEIIHSLNKREYLLPLEIKERIKERDKVILLGDQVSDIEMIGDEKKDEALKIGFCEEKVEVNLKYFEKSFDVVCTENMDFNDLCNEFDILK